MKKLRMKSVEIDAGPAPDGSPRVSSTREVVKLCLDNVPQGGLKLDEMRARLKVLDRLEAANGVCLLEDAEAAVLQRCVSAMTWSRVLPGIVTFCDDVAAMPDAPEATA